MKSAMMKRIQRIAPFQTDGVAGTPVCQFDPWSSEITPRVLVEILVTKSCRSSLDSSIFIITFDNLPT